MWFNQLTFRSECCRMSSSNAMDDVPAITNPLVSRLVQDHLIQDSLQTLAYIPDYVSMLLSPRLLLQDFAMTCSMPRRCQQLSGINGMELPCQDV